MNMNSEPVQIEKMAGFSKVLVIMNQAKIKKKGGKMSACRKLYKPHLSMSVFCELFPLNEDK